MAYDKVVDSSVLNAGLTQIANAIREKAGTSDALAFPAGMAEAIAAIEAGGGGVVTGTIVATGTTDPITITHNFGVVPAMAVVVAEYESDTDDYLVSNTLLATINVYTTDTIFMFRAKRSSSSSANYQLTSGALTNTAAGQTFNSATDSTINIQSNTSYVMSAGLPYYYAILKELI